MTSANRSVRDWAWLAVSVVVPLNYVWNLYRLVSAEVRDGTNAAEVLIAAVLAGGAGLATFWIAAGAWRRTSWHTRHAQAGHSPGSRHDGV